jgi:hypothetical protein
MTRPENSDTLWMAGIRTVVAMTTEMLDGTKGPPTQPECHRFLADFPQIPP